MVRVTESPRREPILGALGLWTDSYERQHDANLKLQLQLECMQEQESAGERQTEKRERKRVAHLPVYVVVVVLIFVALRLRFFVVVVVVLVVLLVHLAALPFFDCVAVVDICFRYVLGSYHSISFALIRWVLSVSFYVFFFFLSFLAAAAACTHAFCFACLVRLRFHFHR